MIVFLIILVASFLLQIVLPWWVIVIVSFITCGLIGKTGKIALWSPFLAIALLWTGVALFKSIPNQHLLASRIAEMLSVKTWKNLLRQMILILAGTMKKQGTTISIISMQEKKMTPLLL